MSAAVDETVMPPDSPLKDEKNVGTANQIGHKHELKSRTQDIHLDEEISFADLGLSSVLIKGLSRSGFEKPSPIQLSAIPHGRCGLDLVVQAKSGTGKTCVFTIIALESVDISIKRPQVLMLAPTREIALQIEEVIKSIGCEMRGLVCHSSIGGLSLKDDKAKVKEAHIVIGTPGRVKQLMELSALNTISIRLFVLDEADKLLEESFQEQINWVFSGLPDSKQVVAASATYTEEFVQHLCNYMHNPTFIRLNSNDPVLLGVRQYKKQVATGRLPNENYSNKVVALIEILSQSNFQQCLVFSNLMTRAENLSKLMVSRGWPTTHIAGSQEQDERIKAITRLKSYDCRILISTDLTSRGIDADRIDLVINLDLPYDSETYLHRVGRAGRFGTNGAAITLYTEAEAVRLTEIAEKIGTDIRMLPDSLPMDFIQNPKEVVGGNRTVQVESFQIMTEKETPSISMVESEPLTGQENVTGTRDGQVIEQESPPQAVTEQGVKNNKSDEGLSCAGKIGDMITRQGVSTGDQSPRSDSASEVSHSLADSSEAAARVTLKSSDGRDEKMSVLQTTCHHTDGMVEHIAKESQTTCHHTDGMVEHIAKESQTTCHHTDGAVEHTAKECEGVSSGSRKLISHRPPFSNLKEAMNFLQDTVKYNYLLATNIYRTEETKIDSLVTARQGVKSPSSSSGSVLSKILPPVVALRNADSTNSNCRILGRTVTNSSPAFQNVIHRAATLREQTMSSAGCDNGYHHGDGDAPLAKLEVPVTSSNGSRDHSVLERASGLSVGRSGRPIAFEKAICTNTRDTRVQTNTLRMKTIATQTECQDDNFPQPNYGEEYSPYYKPPYAHASTAYQYEEEGDDYEYSRSYSYDKHYAGYTRYDYRQGYREPSDSYCCRFSPSHPDPLSRTLDMHYRQVYFQHSYITSMARKT